MSVQYSGPALLALAVCLLAVAGTVGVFALAARALAGRRDPDDLQPPGGAL